MLIVNHEALKPMKFVLGTNIVPNLIRVIDQDKDPQVTFEAVWCISNITSGEHDHCVSVIDSQGIPILVKMLRNANGLTL